MEAGVQANHSQGLGSWSPGMSGSMEHIAHIRRAMAQRWRETNRGWVTGKQEWGAQCEQEGLGVWHPCGEGYRKDGQDRKGLLRVCALWVDSMPPDICPPTLLSHQAAVRNGRRAFSSSDVPSAPSTEKGEHYSHYEGEMLKGIPFLSFAQHVLKGKFEATCVFFNFFGQCLIVFGI